MSYSKEHKEHIEYTFAAFCRVVLRNAALSAYRDIPLPRSVKSFSAMRQSARTAIWDGNRSMKYHLTI